MKFFNIDQHISVIADLCHIFRDLGHGVHSKSLSGHAQVVGLKKADIPLLNGENWCGFWKNDTIDKFTKQYAGEIASCDGIIVTYPPVFARLYEKFDKPIIIDIPIRYEYGTNATADEWNEWNEWLDTNVKSGKVTLVANSRYDQEYTATMSGLTPTYIPSLCAYTNAQYNPLFDKYLCMSSARVEGSQVLVHKSEALPHPHRWQDVTAYRGAVWFPYNASLMSIFEVYTANMPIFVPSLDFMTKLWREGVPVMQQCSWDQIADRASISKDITAASVVHDPNDWRNEAAMRHWWQFADFYQQRDMFPHVTTFNDWHELTMLMQYANVGDISYKMRCDWQRRKNIIYSSWEQVLNKIGKRVVA